MESGFHVDVGTRPVPTDRLCLPTLTSVAAEEAAASAGYAEMTKLLLGRRQLRRVRVLLFEPLHSAGSFDRLEARTRSFAAGLLGMGVRSERLMGRPLLRAAERMGWNPERSA